MFPATVVRASDFSQAMTNGLDPMQFDRIMIAEGDSWMDVSGWANGSLPDFLMFSDRVLIIKTARFGTTVRRMDECLRSGWLNGFINDRGINFRYAAILFSGGGNDFIDAALETRVGGGILADFNGAPPPSTVDECLRASAITQLVSFLNLNFDHIHSVIRSSRLAKATPIFLNLYDQPTVRDAPALPGGKSWLFESFRRHNIPDPLRQDLANKIFGLVQSTVQQWAIGHSNVQIVPTFGTLTPSTPGTSGSSNDWLNEIHPNTTGWKKLASVWQTTIK